MKNKIELSCLLVFMFISFAFISFKEEPPELKITPIAVSGQDYRHLVIDSTTHIVYAAITTKDDDKSTSVQRWEDNKWIPCGGKLTGSVKSLCFHNGKLYAGISNGISQSGGSEDNRTSSVFVYENDDWKKFGDDIEGNIEVLVSFNNELYAGGNYVFGKGDENYSILKHYVDGKWMDCKAKPSSGITSGKIKHACVYKGKLVVIGFFGLTTDNGEAASIAMWDGKSWSSLGFVMKGGSYYALTVYKDELIVGGSFLVTSKGMKAINNIFAWDGSQMKPFRDGLFGAVHCFTVLNDQLYIGGEFQEADKIQSKFLIKWDGTDWHPMLQKADGNSVSDGAGAGVYEMVGYEHELFIEGILKSINDVDVKGTKFYGIAMLDIGK